MEELIEIVCFNCNLFTWKVNVLLTLILGLIIYYFFLWKTEENINCM